MELNEILGLSGLIVLIVGTFYGMFFSKASSQQMVEPPQLEPPKKEEAKKEEEKKVLDKEEAVDRVEKIEEVSKPEPKPEPKAPGKSWSQRLC